MDASTVASIRTFLFIPSHRQDYWEKAHSLAPDAIVLDLEDGVPASAKEQGRKLVNSLGSLSRSYSQIFIRVNPVETSGFALDIKAIDLGAVAGIILPRVETLKELDAARQAITSRGVAISRGDLGLIALIETARGVSHAAEIAAAPGVVGLGFGREDFMANMGLFVFEDNKVAEVSRALVSIAAHAADCAAIDAIYPYYRDAEGLRADVIQGRNLGYSGKFCIHPAQIEIIHQALAPEPHEIDLAAKIVSASQNAGSAVFVLDGRMIDRPMVLWANRILEKVHVKNRK